MGLETNLSTADVMRYSRKGAITDTYNGVPIIGENSARSEGVSRRNFLKLVGGAAGAVALGNALQGCGVKSIHDVFHDYSLIVVDNANPANKKVYTLTEKIDTPEEEEGFRILERRKHEITYGLANAGMNNGTLNEFVNALYKKKDVNEAATVLYHYLRDKPEVTKQALTALGIKVDPYWDWKTTGAIVMVLIGMAAIGVGVAYAIGGRAAAAMAPVVFGQ